MSVSRVLVVEDQDNVLVSIIAILSALGYDAQGVKDPAEAKRAFVASKFDLVLTDINLGEGPDGVRLANDLLTHAPGQPIILMSGFKTPVAHHAQGFVYIDKPFTPRELVEAIEIAMRIRDLSHVNRSERA